MQQYRSRSVSDAWRPGRPSRARDAIPAAATTLLAILALGYRERRLRRRLRDSVEAARIEERARLARDLHDGILQDLAIAGLKLKLARRAPPESTGERIAEIAAIVAAQQARIRQLVERRRRGNGSLVRLGPMLVGHARIVGRRWGCAIDLTVDPPDLAVRSPLADELAYVVSEATANAVRHGGATALRARFERAAEALTATITDNGSGAHPGPERAPRSLADRIGALGGGVSVSGAAPGFELRITLPAAAAV